MLTNNKSKIDFGLFLHIFADFLIHCPKLKFSAKCPNGGSRHQVSIQKTNTMISKSMDLINKLIDCKLSVSFEDHKDDIILIVFALNLITDLELKLKINSTLSKLFKYESSGVIEKMLENLVKFVH
jgi:hypothetical protein